MTQVSEDRRTFFYVPIKNFAKLEREIAKLSKRSQKAGGWMIELTRFGTIENKNTGAKSYEVFLDAPDVRLDGYTFLARLDHSQETGNIIRMMHGAPELPKQYRDVGPKCDHCNINRIRRDTFVLTKDADGSLVQLGSSCMSDFFKTDPRLIMKLAEIVSYARETATAAQDDDFNEGEKAPRTLRDLRYIPMDEFLLNCAAARRLDGGYRSAVFQDRSTRSRALGSLYWGERLLITQEDHDMVALAMQWVEKLAARRDAGENLTQYEHNVLVVGEATVIEGRSSGLAASIIGCFDRQRQPVAPAAPVVAPKPIQVANMDGILALFNKTALRSPKIVIEFPETGEIELTKAGSGAQYPGTINVQTTGGFYNNTWFGRIHIDGRFQRNNSVQLPNGFEKALVMFAIDPAGVAAAYGHRTGRCCFCRRPLKTERATHVGYGETCAHNYGLPFPAQKEMTTLKKAALQTVAA